MVERNVASSILWGPVSIAVTGEQSLKVVAVQHRHRFARTAMTATTAVPKCL
jgi:hypothetical protein